MRLLRTALSSVLSYGRVVLRKLRLFRIRLQTFVGAFARAHLRRAWEWFSEGFESDTIDSPITWARAAAVTRIQAMEQEALKARLYSHQLEVDLTLELVRGLAAEALEKREVEQAPAILEVKVRRLRQ